MTLTTKMTTMMVMLMILTMMTDLLSVVNTVGSRNGRRRKVKMQEYFNRLYIHILEYTSLCLYAYVYLCDCMSACNSPTSLHYALSPLGIWKLRTCQNYDLGSHFIKPELFQMKIFGCYLLYSFTFNSYLGTS